MSQYKTGAVSVTNGSQVVTGTGTLWLSNVSPGDGFTVAGTGVPYTVGSVDSDTQITLNANYAGLSGSGLAYTIWRDFEANTGAPEMSQGDIETATIFTRAIRALGQRLGLATTTVAGIVEKATTTEAQDAAIDKFPDAKGVKDYIKQFGVGDRAPAIQGDVDDIIETGIYTFRDVDGSTGPTPDGRNGLVMHQQYSLLSFAVQWFAGVGSGIDLYHIRYQTSGTWSDWAPVYHGGSILGTVSQSGGIPTGAIIERGSNANGEYTKYADGTLICSKAELVTEFGNASNLVAVWDYPHEFSSEPVVVPQIYMQAFSARFREANYQVYARNTNTLRSNVGFASGGLWVDGDQSLGETINVIAYGRWF